MMSIKFAKYPQPKCPRYLSSCLIIETPEGIRRIQDRHLYELLNSGRATLAPGTVELKKKPDLFKLGAFR